MLMSGELHMRVGGWLMLLVLVVIETQLVVLVLLLRLQGVMLMLMVHVLVLVGGHLLLLLLVDNGLLHVGMVVMSLVVLLMVWKLPVLARGKL
jgi:hypothetical protein